MLTLNQNIDKYIFFNDEIRDYENNLEDIVFLIEHLKLRGVKIETSNSKSYFYCRMFFEEKVVIVDSRKPSGIIPKNYNEAIMLASLFIFGENCLLEYNFN